ncbi:cation:proton antiporter [Candidatus Woesearchaeota archaeon]|nr:cation:proton antiporter [Candidatus Woesearchaeota archaeon]MCF7900936.1 cation:proton antiporter [Candidatus Woesearchaeota archaeon]MCF8012866.1 cation:proton antiporter [Candidatus Woesearchaeota archaeon]
MEPIIALILLIIMIILLRYISYKLKIQPMILFILFGIFLHTSFTYQFLSLNKINLSSLGELGLIILMFLAGLESSWSNIMKEEKDAMYIATFSAGTSFIAGTVLFLLLGQTILVSLIVGTCMSITAEAAKARVLITLKKIKTKVGSAMMGAGLIDDVLGISIFLVITYLFGTTDIKNLILLSSALLAYVIGIVSQTYFGRNHNAIEKIENTALWFIVPFFFVNVGFMLNPEMLQINYLIILAVLIAGIGGKFIGVFMTKKFTKFSFKQLYLIGWSMNSRGGIGLALALLAFNMKLINLEIYSSLIILAIVTTLIFPIVVTRIVKKNPKIMN